MIEPGRFRNALLASVAALLVLAVIPLTEPRTILALAGDRSSPGFRMHTEDMKIPSMSMGGAQVEGTDVAHLSLGGLEVNRVLVIERDVFVSSMAPTAQDWTIAIRAPAAQAPSGIDIYTSRACVRRVGLTRFGLLAGLLDGAINDALASGYQPSLITRLLNLVGPFGLVDITIAEFASETPRVTTPRMSTPRGMTITVTPRRVDPEFATSCL